MKTTKLYFKICLMVCTLAIFSSCEKENTEDDDVDTFEHQTMLDLVNDYRTSGCNCGSEYFPPVEAVTWNETLELAAKNHTEDMNDNSNLSHTGSDGSSPGDRIKDAGYIWSTYGENIAMGYSTEKDVVKGWIESTGHCENIMNGNVTEMGVANVGSYWTQVFATK